MGTKMNSKSMTKKRASAFGFRTLDDSWLMRSTEGFTFLIGPTTENVRNQALGMGLWVSISDVLNYYMIGRVVEPMGGIQALMVKARVFLKRVTEETWLTRDALVDYLNTETAFFENEVA
jgi:hypothetical protein